MQDAGRARAAKGRRMGPSSQDLCVCMCLPMCVTVCVCLCVCVRVLACVF